MTSHCHIYFADPGIDLEAAAAELEACEFVVEHKGDRLVVSKDQSPTFVVTLDAGPTVRAAAAAAGAGTEHASALQACSSRFTVAIADLEEALDEINTLMELQGALQDASDGYLHLPWNGTVSQPWSDED